VSGAPHHRHHERGNGDEEGDPRPGAVPYTYRWSPVPRAERRAQARTRSGDAVEKATVVITR
jgi:hypothetical protein